MTAADPAVAAVEEMLDAASQQPGSEPVPARRARARHALAICACVTTDDAPTWLIYDTPAGELRWRRVPDGMRPLDLVDARSAASGHADPAEVLAWLRGHAADPWGSGGDGAGSSEVLDAVREIINPA